MKKLIFSQGRRDHLFKASSPFPSFHRWLSSDSNQSGSIQPVSYHVKPKDPTPPNENGAPQEHHDQQQEFRTRPRELPNQGPWTGLTREEIRYVKDGPSISPVSYPVRVAPLPEDRVAVEDEGKIAAEGDEMERESRRIEVENRSKWLFRIVEEEEQVAAPFPKLIKPEKKEKKPLFDLMDALRQVKASARTTFDETVEAHVRLGIAKSRSDLIVRGTLTLPHGGKKALRIAVFAEGTDADDARAAGADVVGGVELIDEISRAGKIDVDKCFATVQMYPRIAKLARVLNRYGLMPDSKQGTVVSDVSKAVKDAKKDQIKFKMDKTSIVHVGLGKVSFTEESLRENVGAFMNALLQAKPAGLKKTSKYAGYVNSFHICSTMGPGFPVSIQSLSKAADNYSKVNLKS
ncbi:hypothetical protein JCGZ_12994 [Jatropha curcas]|uniref:Large ribosomal subunit protein uL1c n=2 Tax=Jatropha curcas TaxID=180498 RepID=A0A067KD59_JATCU|nr:hypothetical protein JCGZ_12994 [Jatropha curcas]